MTIAVNENKKQRTTKKMKFLVIFLVIAIISFGVFFAFQNRPEPDSADTKTLNQGTQMHYGDIYIGLVNVENRSGWLSIHRENDTGEPFKKLVAAGEKFEVYGYTIEVKSVKSVTNLIPLSGSSNGYIKFVITKQL